MKRFIALALLGASALSAPPATAGEAALRSIAVLPFDIVDTSGEPRDQTADHARRLEALRTQVAAALAERGVYDVVDLGPIGDDVATAHARERLFACNGCEVTLARRLGTDRVLVAWVKKVSTLVMSLETRVEDTATGRMLIHKSLDFRGDTDEGWRRMGSYLAERFAELPAEAL